MGELQVPEQEWLRHSKWFRAEQIERQMKRREIIIDAIGAVMVVVMVVAVFAMYGGY